MIFGETLVPPSGPAACVRHRAAAKNTYWITGSTDPGSTGDSIAGEVVFPGAPARVGKAQFLRGYADFYVAVAVPRVGDMDARPQQLIRIRRLLRLDTRRQLRCHATASLDYRQERRVVARVSLGRMLWGARVLALGTFGRAVPHMHRPWL